MTRYYPLARGFMVTSGFGPRDGGFHYGTDFGKEGGSGGLPVYAVQGGTVVMVGPASGFGQWVVVDHPAEDGGGTTVYGHTIPEVGQGQRVEAGQRIARINPDSNTNGGVAPHLHLEWHRYVWVQPGPDRRDPWPLLDGARYPGEGNVPGIPDSSGGGNKVDTLFADVSYFQVPVDDSYPYPILSIRSNDGTFRDPNFAHNYEWCVRAVEDGRLACFIVYLYVRTNWAQTAETHIDMVRSMGGPHPKMISMLDVESGGNPGGDGSDWINRTFWRVADWLGDPKRVIGYANRGDFDSMWRTRPDGLRIIGAGYGSNPNLPGQIAHQYTDGRGFGGGLPEGAPPFGNCDMNAANGMSGQDFAAACGVGNGEELDMDAVKHIEDFITGFVGPIGQDVKTTRQQLTGGRDEGEYPGWTQLGDQTVVDALAEVRGDVAEIKRLLTEKES